MSAGADGLIDELLRLRESRSHPPVAQWHPERTGRVDIVIRADGTWWHEGGQIKRPGLVRLLASVLRLDDAGYCLVTPEERMFIEVEDVPFIAVDLDIGGARTADSQVVLTTNVDDIVLVDGDHRLWIEDASTAPRPYVHVRDGLNARLSRSVFYRLVEAADDTGGQLEIRSAGHRFVLSEVPVD